MNIKEISPGIVLVSFPNKKELTFTMCRVEEFYEAASVKLQGQVFTWSDFIDEFMDTSGNIDYFHFWSGFNIPGDIFTKWATSFTDLSSREVSLINAVNNITSKKDTKFYVIATEETNADSVEDHEIAHAKFYIDEEYKKEMIKLNNNLDITVRKLLIDKFAELGYSETVYEDELQAYLATSEYAYMKNRFGMTEEQYNRTYSMYVAVFKKYR